MQMLGWEYTSITDQLCAFESQRHLPTVKTVVMVKVKAMVMEKPTEKAMEKAMVKAIVNRTHRLDNRTDPDRMLNTGLDCVQAIWTVWNDGQAKIPREVCTAWPIAVAAAPSGSLGKLGMRLVGYRNWSDAVGETAEKSRARGDG